VNVAFFPNPQAGEFYNGLQEGCGSNTAPCGNESGDASDNPFAFTRIEVPAGGGVDNVNIFLNTSTAVADILENPGFNFCELGDVDGNGDVERLRDVDGDGIPDQGDILAVVQAKEAFDAGQPFNQRADLNEDGSVTFLDIDIITDIVTIPDPFFGNTLAEIKRGLAPFQAICTAAAQGGCRIQAPPTAIRGDGTPTPDFCDAAESLGGCEIIGCPPSFEPVGCTAINVPTTLDGNLSLEDQESFFRAGRLADCHTFSGNEGQQISIRMQSVEVDTFLFLVGPDGELVDSNDDCPGDGLNSCIPFNTLEGGFVILPSDGTYAIEATSFGSGQTGSYSLTVSEGGT